VSGGIFYILSPLNVNLNTKGCFYNLSDTGQIELKYQVNDSSSFVGPGENDEDLAAGSVAALHLPEICSSKNSTFGSIPFTLRYCLVEFEPNSTNQSSAKPVVTITASNQDTVGTTTCCFAENNLTEYYAFRNLVRIKPLCSSFPRSEGFCVFNLSYCVYENGTELAAELTVVDPHTHWRSSKNISLPLNVDADWNEASAELKALIDQNPYCEIRWRFLLIPFVIFFLAVIVACLLGMGYLYYKNRRRRPNECKLFEKLFQKEP